MFATILQQSTPMGIEQVAVVPLFDGSVRQFARQGKNLRGVAGAWKEITVPPAFTGKAVGAPRSVLLTAADYSMLQYPITPTVLVQKLVRLVKDENTVGTEDFSEVYRTVIGKAEHNQASLAVYLAEPVAVFPTVAEPEPGHPTLGTLTGEVRPAEFVPEPVSLTAIAEQFFPVGVPAEPVAPSYEMRVEPSAEIPLMPMDYGTVAPALADSHAVLTVPAMEPYFARKFYGKTERELYDVARSEAWNVLLTGEAGTGKTSSARNYAAENNLPFVTIECTQQIDQSITQGRFVPTGMGNSVVWKYSQLATAIQQPSVILINELTRMTAKAASLFLRLLSERELLIEPLNEVIKVHPGVIFIADQNTGIGYTGTSRQDSALVDRFDVKLEFHYDTAIEANFIKSPTLLSFASNIREASELNDEFSVPMSTRILKNFVAQAPRLNFEFAVNSLMSNYPKVDGERDAIKMRFDAEADAIASELGVTLGKYSTN